MPMSESPKTKEFLSQFDILIVEDDAMLNKVMTIQLTCAGLTVRSAENGQTALNMIKERIPSVLILDLGLADMTGYEVVEQLRQNPITRFIPLIIHTTFDLTSDQASRLQLGPSRFVTKSTAYSDALAELVLELVQVPQVPSNLTSALID
jgi:CheY-like chemotaxis protein